MERGLEQLLAMLSLMVQASERHWPFGVGKQEQEQQCFPKHLSHDLQLLKPRGGGLQLLQRHE